MRSRWPKTNPSAAPRARMFSRFTASCSGVKPYFCRRCSATSCPCAGMSGFSSNGWKWISALTLRSSLSNACSSAFRPMMHHGHETSETKSILSGMGWLADMSEFSLATLGGKFVDSSRRYQSRSMDFVSEYEVQPANRRKIAGRGESSCRGESMAMSWTQARGVRYVVAMLVALLICACANASTAFPLQASANGRYLVDQNGVPFRIQGEASWDAHINLNLTDLRAYLDDRQTKHFNALFTYIANPVAYY